MAIITINRALSLVKKMEENINSNIRDGIFVSLVYKSSKRPVDKSFQNTEELLSRIQSDTDKVNTALKLIPKIKEAIAKKNLETFVDIKGVKYTVTEVLAMKSLINSRRLFVTKWQSQIEAANQKIQSSLDTTNSNADNQKLTVEERQAILQLNELIMVTGSRQSPASLLEEIKKENEILVDEIDFLLSEINVNTTIEVEGL